jgi:excisionase family DNA binding protein
MEPIDHLLTPQHVAEILGLPLGAIRMRIKRRQLPSVKMGRRNMVPESLLRTYMSSLQTTRDRAAVHTEQLSTVNGTSVDQRAEHMTRKVLLRHVSMSASAVVHRSFEFMDNLARIDEPQPEFVSELDTAIRAMGQLRQYLEKKL